MEESIAEQVERYIEQAVRTELTQIAETEGDEQLRRIRFWQDRSHEDRFRATSEIVRRVHLARGGSIADLKVKRSIARLVRKK